MTRALSSPRGAAACAALSLVAANGASAQEAPGAAPAHLSVQVDIDVRAAAACAPNVGWVGAAPAGVRFVRRGDACRVVVRIVPHDSRWTTSGTAWTRQGESLGSPIAERPTARCDEVQRSVARVVAREVTVLRGAGVCVEPSPPELPRRRPVAHASHGGLRLLLGATATPTLESGFGGFGGTMRIGGALANGLYLGVAAEGHSLVNTGTGYRIGGYGVAFGTDIGVELRAGPLTLMPHVTLGAEYIRFDLVALERSTTGDRVVSRTGDAVVFRATPAALLAFALGPFLLGIDAQVNVRLGDILGSSKDPMVTFSAAALLGFRTGG